MGDQMAICSVPNCTTPVLRGCVLCTDHHFALPPKQARLILRTAIERDRAADPEKRARLSALFESYLKTAISQLAPASPTGEPSSAFEDLGYRRRLG